MFLGIVVERFKPPLKSIKRGVLNELGIRTLANISGNNVFRALRARQVCNGSFTPFFEKIGVAQGFEIIKVADGLELYESFDDVGVAFTLP